MTSTTTGLPDRYRPIDQVGPDEPTSTGVIQCWRAKDRVLNRDVAIRVHTPAGPAAHAWISREFGWVPTSFFRQMGACARAGHLVAVDDTVDGLPDDLVAAPPRTTARFTLLAGSENRCFLPSGQRRTHGWLNGRRPGSATLEVLPGYSHMDVFFGRDAPREVFPRIVAALGR